MLENIRPNEENDEIQKGPYHLTAPKIMTPLNMFFSFQVYINKIKLIYLCMINKFKVKVVISIVTKLYS